MKIYPIVSLFVSIAIIGIGVFVLASNYKSQLYRTWFFLSIAVSIAGFGWAFRDLATNEVDALFWGGKVLYTSIIFVPAFFIHFVVSFLGSNKKYSLHLKISYLLAIFLWVITSTTSLVVKGMAPKFSFNYFTVPGPLSSVVFIYFSVVMFYANYLLLQEFKRSTGFRRNQVKYLFLATFIAFLGGLSSYLPIFKIFNSPLFSYGNVLIIFFSATSAYAILKYRLMDFNLLARWGLAYGLLIALLGLFALLIVTNIEKYSHKVGMAPGFSIIICVCIVVYILDPLRRNVSNFVDYIIFKSPDYDLILSDLNRTLKGCHSIDDFSNNLCRKINEIWKIKHSGLVIWNSQNGSYDPLPFFSFSTQIISKIGMKIDRADFLIRTLETEKRLFKYGIVIEDELTLLGNRSRPGERTTFWKIRRTMRWLGASICVPLTKGSDLLGFIVLGPKPLSSFYSNEDRKLLSHLAGIVSPYVLNLIVAET